MSIFIQRLLWNAPSQPTNIVGIALSLIPGDTTLQFDVWRAPDASGSPGTFVEVGQVGPFSQAGGIFLDQLPSSTAVWWYKVRHVGPTVDPGNFTTPISSTAYPIRKAIYDAWINGTNIYPLQRPRAWSDGSWAATAQTNDGLTLHTNVTDANARNVKRMLAKAVSTDPDTTDGVPEGTMTTRNYQYGNAADLEIDNANFEAAAVGSTSTVPGWVGVNATISLDATTPYAGNTSLKVVSSSQFGSATSIRRWFVRVGDQYKVTAAMRANTGTDQADCQLQFLNAGGGYISGIQPATSSTSWLVQSQTGTVPAGAVYAQLTLQNNNASPGTVWFDAVSVKLVRSIDDEVFDGVNFHRTQASDMTGNRINLVPRGFRWEGQNRTAIQNLTYDIPNSEFDVWETNTQPHAWTIDTGDSSAALKDTTTVFSGDSSCQYQFGGGGAAGDLFGLSTNDPVAGAWCVPLQPQTWYRIKFPWRAAATGCQMKVTLDHNSGSPGTLTTTQTYTIGAANAWQIDMLLFMTPTTAKPLTKIQIQFNRNSTTATNFWVDGIRLIEIGTQRQIILTSGTSWTVPSDFNPVLNVIELWGPGGNSAGATANANGGGGGGGGGYRYVQNFNPGTLTSIPYVIGTSGTNTSWNSGAVVANTGANAAGSTAGNGGSGSGGTGGNSGGPGGAGRVGTGSSGGGGGGGAGGFAATGGTGSPGTNAAGGAGGAGANGTVNNPSATGGSAGTGGAIGSNGGDGNEYTLITAGSGGGGGGSFNPTGGGGGGHYGGGAGGGGCTSGVAGSSTNGQQGCIVITYITPA